MSLLLPLGHPSREKQGCPPREEMQALRATIPMDAAANQAVIVSDRKRGDAWRPLFIGESINRYQVSRRLWIDTGKDGINYKEQRFYQGKRLLVRKTGIGIMATIDDSAAYTNQVVFTWKMREDLDSPLSRYRLEYLLGTLNSR